MSQDTATGAGDLREQPLASIRSRRPEFEAAGENALAARQHVAVSEEFYEAAGRERIGSPNHDRD